MERFSDHNDFGNYEQFATNNATNASQRRQIETPGTLFNLPMPRLRISHTSKHPRSQKPPSQQSRGANVSQFGPR